MAKFKVGDLVVRIKKNMHLRYDFKNNGITSKPGDVFKIISVGGDKHSPLYSVEGAYILKPNWNGMEEHFDLYKIQSWKEKIGDLK